MISPLTCDGFVHLRGPFLPAFPKRPNGMLAKICELARLDGRYSAIRFFDGLTFGIKNAVIYKIVRIAAKTLEVNKVDAAISFLNKYKREEVFPKFMNLKKFNSDPSRFKLRETKNV